MKFKVYQERKIEGRFKEFIDKFGPAYPKEVLDLIIKEFINNYELETKLDFITQVYAETGYIEDKYNPYKGFLTLLLDKHGVDCNILEVGGGYFPVMSKYIDEIQQQGKIGSITVYDPKLVTTSLGKIKLIKERVLPSINLTGYDLILGILPCEATELTIRLANSNQKPFFIALCHCNHINGHNWFDPINKWHQYIQEVARQTLCNDAILTTDYLDSRYEFEDPIISTIYENNKSQVKTYK